MAGAAKAFGEAVAKPLKAIKSNEAVNKIKSSGLFDTLVDKVANFSTAGADALEEAASKMDLKGISAAGAFAKQVARAKGLEDLGEVKKVFKSAEYKESFDDLMGYVKDAGVDNSIRQSLSSANASLLKSRNKGEVTQRIADRINKMESMANQMRSQAVISTAEALGHGVEGALRSTVDFWIPNQGELTGTGNYLKRVGGYAAGAIGIRMVAGGTLTRNNKGRRDIAGIPLV